MIEHDGWNYDKPTGESDARRIVTLKEDGMVWVGIRAWDHLHKRWQNNNEPERAKVIAWRDLPEPARGYYDRGILHVPRVAMSSLTELPLRFYKPGEEWLIELVSLIENGEIAICGLFHSKDEAAAKCFYENAWRILNHWRLNSRRVPEVY